MTRQHTKTTNSTSFSFRLRLPNAIRELEREIEDVLESSWDQGNRRRASDIAFALSEACRLEGQRDAAAMARSIACLMNVSPEKIRPLEGAFREKIIELLTFLKDISDDLLTDSSQAGRG